VWCFPGHRLATYALNHDISNHNVTKLSVNVTFKICTHFLINLVHINSLYGLLLGNEELN